MKNQMKDVQANNGQKINQTSAKPERMKTMKKLNMKTGIRKSIATMVSIALIMSIALGAISFTYGDDEIYDGGESYVGSESYVGGESSG